jgi:hypothetical protein
MAWLLPIEVRSSKQQQQRSSSSHQALHNDTLDSESLNLTTLQDKPFMQGATLNRPGIAPHNNMWTSILKKRAPLLHALRNFTENN